MIAPHPIPTVVAATKQRLWDAVSVQGHSSGVISPGTVLDECLIILQAGTSLPSTCINAIIV
jgi:hypothetical protein